MIKIKLLILLFLYFTIIFYFYEFYPSEAQDYYKKSIPLLDNFIDIKNSEINIQLKYPKNWTVQYTKGNNNSILINPESFAEFSKMLEKEEYYKDLNDFDRYQYFLKYVNINTNCIFTSDCSLIRDIYLQSYIIDSQYLHRFLSLFDYLPSIRFLTPAENSTDNFLENIKIASFTLPLNYTLSDFIDYYLYYHKTIPSIDIKSNCQSYVLGYPACKINYIFTAGNNIEYKQYENLEIFIEKDKRIYLFSYNSSPQTYLKYIEFVQFMLESLKFL